MTDPSPAVSGRLDSWKEIAAYLKRDITTVQRWEKREGLPVHRHLHTTRGSVYAFSSELDAWWQNRRDLETLQESSPATSDAWLPKRRRISLISAALGTAAALVAAALVISRPARTSSRSDATVIGSLAVLTLEGDGNVPEWFLNGLTDELIDDLARRTDLRVISRQSTGRYHGTKTPAAEVAQALNAEAVLRGSISRTGQRTHLTLTLIDPSTERLRWKGRFEKPWSDVFALVDDAGRAISVELRGRGLDDHVDAPRARPRNLEAFELFLLGRVQCGRWTPEEFWRGVSNLEKSILTDPNYPPAYAALAGCYGSAAFFGHTRPAELLEKQRAALAKADTVSNATGLRHQAGARLSFYSEWNWPKAERLLEEAIEHDPNNAQAYLMSAWVLAAVGRFDEAFDRIEKARHVDPLSIPFRLGACSVSWFARHYERAVVECRNAVDQESGHIIARVYLGWALLVQGSQDEAVAELERAATLAPDNPFTLAMRTHGYATAGRIRAAEASLKELLRLSRRRYVSPYYLSLIYTALGRREIALDWLERAYEERVGWMVWLNVDQRFDSLRAEPRFQAIHAKMNFPKPSTTIEAKRRP